MLARRERRAGRRPEPSPTTAGRQIQVRDRSIRGSSTSRGPPRESHQALLGGLGGAQPDGAEIAVTTTSCARAAGLKEGPRSPVLLRSAARGRSLEPDGDEPEPALCLDEPGLAACYAAAARGVAVSGERAGQPLLVLLFGKPSPAGLEPSTAAPVAEHRGVNVHAKQCVDGRDRRQLERLCRYIARPPIAQDRLERRADGRLELSFKRPWKDGTRAVVLEPDDLMVRLCAAVPPPRFHLVRYFGVLASHASKRREVVPEPPDDPSAYAPPPAPGDQLELVLDDQGDAARPTRKRWSWLLAHVFAADLDTCPRCQGPMRWLQAATTRDAASQLLARLGLAPQPPPAPRRTPAGQLTFPFVC